MKTSNPEKSAAYTISWHLVKPHTEKKFNAFENESELSEGDFVVKIWRPILEVLFSKASVVLHCGDTLSQLAQEGKMAHRRMDFRFLFSSGSSNDVGDAEFGKKACVTKLYYDKEKSMINGKAQLNEIASIYSLDACDIRLCLVQILGFETVVYEMFSERKGVYALRKAKEFSAPISARGIRNDSEEFFEGLLTRSIVIEPSVIYHGSLKKKGRMSRVAYDNKPASVTRMPPSMATVVFYVE